MTLFLTLILRICFLSFDGDAIENSLVFDSKDVISIQSTVKTPFISYFDIVESEVEESKDDFEDFESAILRLCACKGSCFVFLKDYYLNPWAFVSVKRQVLRFLKFCSWLE
jgi:hypothetical protein